MIDELDGRMEALCNRPVTVADMMAAREARAARQQDWLARHGLPLISLTLNIAGPVKVTPEIVWGFARAERLVAEQLARHGMPVRAHARFDAFTGLEALWAVEAEDMEIKRRMAQVEEAGAFGRLLDIDVLGADGAKLGREAIGLPPRACLLCGEVAAVCARSRAHSAEALLGRTLAILRDTFRDSFAAHVAGLAQRALLYEVAVTPKPGLVDRDNNGAHADMDFFTFLASASVLPSYFAHCVQVGMQGAALPAVFDALRYPGMVAETDMLRATGQVNTHKGAIFSLGILCAAAGYAQAHHMDCAPDTLCALAADMTGDVLHAEVAALNGPAGARGEAMRGFPSVRQAGLPALKARLAAGDTDNDAGVYAMVALLAQVRDANVARRGGVQAADALMARAQALLADYSIDKVRTLDDDLRVQWLSPGGGADLLAVSFFLWLLETESFPA